MSDMYEVLTAKAWERGRQFGESQIGAGFSLVDGVLSGEFAGTPLPNEVLRDLGIDPDTADDFLIADVCDAWEEGYYSNEENQ